MNRTTATATLALAAAMQSTAAPGQEPQVPLMLPASDNLLQSFVRLIIKEGNEAGEVRITAVDDGGNVYDPVTIQLAAGQSFHFNSSDLTDGNAAKGIEGIGAPIQGNWRLTIETNLDVEVLSYARARDGFLTATHELLPAGDDGYLVKFFNPASNATQQSRLRLINWGSEDEAVQIEGVDDSGNNAGPVSVTLPAGQTRTLTAVDLEQGAHGLDGTLGDGAGKWQLNVRANGNSVAAQSLLYASSGHISNLSAEGFAAIRAVGDDGNGDRIGDACNVMGDCAPTLALNGQQSGRIDPVGDVDYYRLVVNAYGSLKVYTDGNIDTAGELYGSDGTAFGDDDNGGDAGNFRIEYAARPCTYFVRVEAVDGSGSYTLHNEFKSDSWYEGDEHAGHGGEVSRDDFACATNLALGGRQSGTIDVDNDVDVFRVSVTESGTLTVYTTSDIHTVGSLYGSENTRTALASNDGYFGDFRIVHEVDAGEYFVTVGVYYSLAGDTRIGDYTVHAEFTPI